MPERIDLADLLQSGSVTVTPNEHDEDRSARIWRDNCNHISSLAREWVTFLVVMALMGMTFYFAIDTLLFQVNARPAAIEWANRALIALGSGALSFFLGRATK